MDGQDRNGREGSARDILVAVIGRPHGVRGLVHVTSYASSDAALAAMRLRDADGGTWRIDWRGERVAALTGHDGRTVADRDAAEALVNTRLYVSRDDLPEPDEDEFYLADLVGLDARAPAGDVLGQVRAVHDYGAGASLEIAPPGDARGAFLVPFTRASVPAVDLARRVLTVCRPDEIEARA